MTYMHLLDDRMKRGQGVEAHEIATRVSFVPCSSLECHGSNVRSLSLRGEGVAVSTHGGAYSARKPWEYLG